MKRLRMRLRCESGLGLLELLVAIVILNVALLALLAALSAGASSLHRAGRTSTAAALADSQLELYRALSYDAIALDSAALATAESTDAVYGGDRPRDAGGALLPDVGGSCAAPLPPQCDPRRTVAASASGDHQSYRVDTYVTQVTPPGGRAGKQVTVIVRDGTRPGTALARVTSFFDPALG